MTLGSINQLYQYPTQEFAPLFPVKDPVLDRLDRIESALGRIEAALDKRERTYIMPILGSGLPLT